MKPSRVLGAVGGLVDLASLAMPWIAISAQGLVTLSVGISPLDMFQGLVTNPNTESSDPSSVFAALSQLPEGIALRIAMMVVGIIIFLISAIVALFRPHGGFGMLIGSLLFLGGASLFFVSFGLFGTSTSIGPGFGLWAAFIGSIVAILGVFLRDPSPQPGSLYPAYPIGAWPPIPPPPPPPPVGTIQRAPMSQSVIVNLPPSAIRATQPTNAPAIPAAAIPYANPLPPPPPEGFTTVPKSELVSSMCRKCGAPLSVGVGACPSCGFC